MRNKNISYKVFQGKAGLYSTTVLQRFILQEKGCKKLPLERKFIISNSNQLSVHKCFYFLVEWIKDEKDLKISL